MKIITDPDKLEKIITEIFEKVIGKQSESKFNKPFLTTDDLIELTGWSRRTIQELRTNKEIPYIKHDRKVLYSRDKVYQFLKAHTINQK